METISEWAAPILTSFAAIIAAAFTCKWQMQTEMRKILENYVSDKKYKAYYNAVNLFYTIMNDNKKEKTKTKTKNSTSSPIKFEDILKVKQDLFVYGSDEAFRAFTNFLCVSTDHQQVDIFTPYLDFMLIVRKEISGGKSTITTDDILLNLMQSSKELQRYHELANNK